MKTYSKKEFCAWLAAQGNREFCGSSGDNCAMTQFGRTVDPQVTESACGHENLNAVLFTSDNGYNRRPVGHIDLTGSEVSDIITSENFAQALARIS